MELYSLLATGSLVIAIIGLFFLVKVMIRLKNIDKDVLKARVFFNRKFLERNCIYIFLTGATLTAHQFIKFLVSFNYITDSWILQFSYILEFASLLFLIILAYEWYILLHRKKLDL